MIYWKTADKKSEPKNRMLGLWIKLFQFGGNYCPDVIQLLWIMPLTTKNELVSFHRMIGVPMSSGVDSLNLYRTAHVRNILTGRNLVGFP